VRCNPLRRPNFVLVALALVIAVGLGLEVYLLARPRRAARVADATAVAPDPVPEATSPPARQMPAPPPGWPAPPPIAAPPAPAAPGARAGQPPPLLPPTTDAARRQADQMVFAALPLDADQRAAVLRINDAFTARVFALRNAPVVNGTEAAGYDAAAQTRRADLRQLLGTETAARFEAAEQAAFRRLQRR
jgi:hypothetical protein